MKTQEFLEQIGDFTWLFGCELFIETAVGNFVWRNPDLLGDNTLTYTSKTYTEYTRSLPYPGRSKGHFVIGDYVGKDVIFSCATRATLSRF